MQTGAGMKIAIVCDNASFRMGGEAAIPLRFFRSFRALGARPVLLTHARVRTELQEILTPEELQNTVFFEDLWLQKQIFSLGRLLPLRLREIFIYGLIASLTERRQARHLRKLARDGALDVVFQPIPISPKVLSLITVPGTPVFFGPLNGAMDYPPAFRTKSGPVSDAVIAAGRAMAEPLHYLFPAKRRAAGIFVSNPRTLAALPRATRQAMKYRSYDATVDSDHWRQSGARNSVDSRHFLYVGRLVDWKAVDIAIRAAHALDGRARLTIVGDGPERARLEALAATGPAEITFAGHLTHQALLGLYGSVCAQLLPSLREAGGNVCMEALATATPVIATRWGGPSDVVRDGHDGILIAPESEDALIRGFAEAMTRLMDDPTLAQKMGARGRARVLDAFGWQAKARDYLALFQAAAAGTRTDPGPEKLADIHPAHQDSEHVNVAWQLG